MDESRKQFEAEIEHSYGEDYLVVNDDGDYVNWITADLWEFWQASREAIEIEIPSRINNVYLRTPLEVEDMCRERMKKTLRAAGIKVKE